MLRFINDFQVSLNGPLDAAGTVLPLAAADAARLDLASGGEYLLTLTDNLDATQRTAVEIVRVSDGLAIQRGLEGTAARAWGSGALVMCSITAGGLAEVASTPIVAPVPPSSAPDKVGAEWIAAVEEGLPFIYRASGTGHVYDWQRIDRQSFAPFQVIAIDADAPLPVQVLPHHAVDVYVSGATNPVQRLVLPALKAFSDVVIPFIVESADSLTLEVDFSNVPGGHSQSGPGAWLDNRLTSLTVTQSQSLITITLGPGDYVFFDLAISTGDPAQNIYCSARILADSEPETSPVPIV
ncbi:hypothetical protein SAMN05216421_1117 [Halopseudomonas xinjiangensis]|uniref:Uncharacterized protein n=1 Tax=Halopseudomonas xinjiangensis TaxID=487184 RepID=A0A1H1QFP9_9GAMM|nr:hypothetical protein [Halopseudomonas xinjiangensis]SDS21709.1 hypothetical protein SAMN05216421_1117 [Halopseudomonas xinjiangensis]